MKMLWRSIVFIFTLLLIYLLFPILIVPSSLPAIQQMFVENELPKQYAGLAQSPESADAQIYELEVPTVPNLKDKLRVLRQLHRQGMALILQR